MKIDIGSLFLGVSIGYGMLLLLDDAEIVLVIILFMGAAIFGYELFSARDVPRRRRR